MDIKELPGNRTGYFEVTESDLVANEKGLENQSKIQDLPEMIVPK